ncbi:MAG: MAPEG family protein [Oleiphilus sp.]
MFNLFIGLSVLLIIMLAMNISRLRMKYKVANGDGNNKEINKAIRAHMNSLEHILPFSLLLYVLQTQMTSTVIFAILAFSFLCIRLLHSYSMLSSKFKLRQITAASTYFLELSACILVLINTGI